MHQVTVISHGIHNKRYYHISPPLVMDVLSIIMNTIEHG